MIISNTDNDEHMHSTFSLGRSENYHFSQSDSIKLENYANKIIRMYEENIISRVREVIRVT